MIYDIWDIFVPEINARKTQICKSVCYRYIAYNAFDSDQMKLLKIYILALARLITYESVNEWIFLKPNIYNSGQLDL